MQEIGILEVGGFQVGQAQDLDAATGITVLLCDTCAPAGETSGAAAQPRGRHRF